MLVGRDHDLRTLRALLDEARAGRAGAMCVHGPVGVGKTSLLSQLVDGAGDEFLVLRTRGIESAAHLAHAALAEVLDPILDLRTQLPPARSRALGAALALENASVASPFAVAAGVLGLLAAAAVGRPLVVLVDDLQWVDEASRAALLFAAHRLEADAVAVLFGLRDGEGLDPAALGLPTLAMGGLNAPDARELLRGRHPDLDKSVAERLVAATAGNPMALIEIPPLLDAQQRRGAGALPDPLPLGRNLARAYVRPIETLSQEARAALLLVACATSREEAAACGATAATSSALLDVERSGLVRLDAGRIETVHPLVRSAALAAATPEELRAAHGHLAAALPPGSAARAWHAAAAAVGTDDEVASALAAAGEAARSGGAFADAACALARAGDLTTDPDRRARLLLEAAASAVIAGRLPWGRQLIARAEESVRDPLLAADLRATLARVQARAGSPGPGADRLVAEAERLLPGEPQRAAMFLLEAAAIDMAAGRLHRLVERAARSQELAADVLPGVAGLARILVAEAQIALGDGEEGDAVLAAAEGDLVRFVPGTGPIEIVAMAAQSSMWVERFDRAEAILERLISTLRDAGLVTELVYPLAVRAQVQLRLGRTQRALADASEAVALGEEGALDTVLVVALGVLAEVEATLGQDEACWSHATRAVGMAEAMGAPAAALYGHAALALLELGRGRIEEAADHGLAAERAEALTDNDEAAIARYLANLAEALWRTGDSAGARERAEVLERQGARPGHSWAAGCAARLRGLLAADDAVDAWFAAALEHHGPNDRPFEAARTRLLHGERLRRARRPADARRPLRAALATFERMGALTWAERARAELRAAGGPAPARDAAPGSDPLTPQELQVALLAAQGQTNREIGAGLFLSPKTVEHHLSRTFRKLGIRRRSELAGALPAE